jgi:16S rRNA processing protein RimM
MINLDDCIQLGFLTKPHGIKGHLVLKLNDFSFEEIEEMELVFIIVDGLPVPFFIEEFSERNNNTLTIKLEDINSEPQARKYSESVVYIKRNVLVDSNIEGTNINAYKGFTVIDNKLGEIGIFDSILDYEKNPIMRVLKHNKEILIPYHQEFIINIHEEDKKIFVDCPEGLLDLYL